MNQQILSQDEVDALLQGITGESQTTSADDAPAADKSGVREYDIANQERIVRGRMPTMDAINERFARNLRHTLFELLRKTPEISIAGTKVQKYSAFLREIVVPSNFNIVTIKPLRGTSLVVADPTLVFAMIDSLFGGAGKYQTRIEGRDFSATEQRVIERMVEAVLAAFKKAWDGIYPIDPEYQRSEMQPQFANIAANSEVVVTSSFSVEIGDSNGSLHVCMPYASLEPIRDVLHGNLVSDSNEPDRRWLKLMKDQLQSAEVELVAELAEAPATIEQLLAYKPGDFIELDLSPIVSAKVSGVPVFACHYGTSNGKYALKVDQLLTTSPHTWLGDSNAA